MGDEDLTEWALLRREYNAQLTEIAAKITSAGATHEMSDDRLIGMISAHHDCADDWFDTMGDALREVLSDE